MRAEEFMRAITAADFKTLIGDDLGPFLDFLDKSAEQGQDRVIIRFMFQKDNEDQIPTPYYIWASYPVDVAEEEELVIYAPDFNDLKTLLETPEDVQGLPYFEIIVG